MFYNSTSEYFRIEFSNLRVLALSVFCSIFFLAVS